MFLEVEALQAAGGNVLFHQVQRHVAPAEAGQLAFWAVALIVQALVGNGAYALLPPLPAPAL